MTAHIAPSGAFQSQDAGQLLRDTELRLHLALAAAEIGFWDWHPPDPDALRLDARCRRLFGVVGEAAIDFAHWISLVQASDRAMATAALAQALDPLNTEDGIAVTIRVAPVDGMAVFLEMRGQAVFEVATNSPGGRRAARILCTVRDVSLARRMEQRQQRSETMLRAIIETAPGLIYAKDREGRMLLANKATLALIGKPWEAVAGRTDAEFLDDPQQAENVMTNDRRLMESNLTETLEELVGRDGDANRVWFSNKAPMCDPQGAVVGLVGVSMEITERKRVEETLRLMVNELNHRVKNILATVQAITLQSSLSTDAAVRRALEGRLMALASVHDVLTAENWEGAGLHELVERVLAPFGGLQGGRFNVSGPRLRLQPRAAQTIAMGLHELMTNALKYGALSRPEGQVDVMWHGLPGAVPMFALLWAERGGPPVTPPASRGFGTRLIERGVAQDLGGSVRMRFDRPDGLVCQIEAVLADVLAQPGVMPLPAVGMQARAQP